MLSSQAHADVFWLELCDFDYGRVSNSYRFSRHDRHPGLDPGSPVIGQSQGIAGQARNDGFAKFVCCFCNTPDYGAEKLWMISVGLTISQG